MCFWKAREGVSSEFHRPLSMWGIHAGCLALQTRHDVEVEQLACTSMMWCVGILAALHVTPFRSYAQRHELVHIGTERPTSEYTTRVQAFR